MELGWRGLALGRGRGGGCTERTQGPVSGSHAHRTRRRANPSGRGILSLILGGLPEAR